MRVSTSAYLSKLKEISDNAVFVFHFRPFLLKHRTDIAGHFYSLDNNGTSIANEFNKKIEHASSDTASIFQGLILQTTGVLEEFIGHAVTKYVEAACQHPSHWDKDRRASVEREYVVRAGQGLRYEPIGTWDGVDFDFQRLRENLSTIFSVDKESKFSGDVFVVRMGTCTSEKIEKLFKNIGFPNIFNVDFGKLSAIKSFTGENVPTKCVNRIKEDLDALANLRNRLAHGMGTAGVDLTTTLDAVALVEAMVLALSDCLSFDE